MSLAQAGNALRRQITSRQKSNLIEITVIIGVPSNPHQREKRTICRACKTLRQRSSRDEKLVDEGILSHYFVLPITLNFTQIPRHGNISPTQVVSLA